MGEKVIIMTIALSLHCFSFHLCVIQLFNLKKKEKVRTSFFLQIFLFYVPYEYLSIEFPFITLFSPSSFFFYYFLCSVVPFLSCSNFMLYICLSGLTVFVDANMKQPNFTSLSTQVFSICLQSSAETFFSDLIMAQNI